MNDTDDQVQPDTVPLIMQGEPSLLDIDRAWSAAFDCAMDGNVIDAIAARSIANCLLFEYVTGPFVDIAHGDRMEAKPE